MRIKVSQRSAAKQFKRSANVINSRNRPKVLKRGGIRL